MISAMSRIAIAMHDFDKAVAMFRDVFEMPVSDFSSNTVPSLGAHVGMCQPEGGSNIELMSPGSADAPLAKSIQGFLDRRGEGLFALMLEAPDPDAEADAIVARGVDVLPLMHGAGGRDIHPRSTGGVLIRVYPDNSVAQPSRHDASDVGLSGITRVIIATTDAAATAAIWGHGLGLTTDAAIDDRERGVRSVRCHPPKGGQIEFVSVLDTATPLGRSIATSLDERGQGMYALVLEAADATRAADLLTDRGLSFRDTPDGAETTAFGTRIIISPPR